MYWPPWTKPHPLDPPLEAPLPILVAAIWLLIKDESDSELASSKLAFELAFKYASELASKLAPGQFIGLFFPG